MRKVSCAAALTLPFIWLAPASAETFTLNQNQTGFTLPGVNTPGGYDEVRAADGTTCRSSIGNSGPYVDVGAVGNHQDGSFGNGAVYGRVIVPLGRRGGRPDCRRLYQLELERLEMEVRLMRAGLGAQVDGGLPAASPRARSYAAPIGAPSDDRGDADAGGVPLPRIRQTSGGADDAPDGEGDWTDTAFSGG